MVQSVQDLQRKIEQEIISYSKSISGIPPELYEPMSYMLSLGGKRMRPLMTLLACDLFEKPVESAYNAAIAVEVFHNFTLIHDDIMDNAPKRRNKETVHKKWNANIAILAGDAMMIKAYQLLLNHNPAILPDLLEIFSKTALQICEGQQMDMNYETMLPDINQYMNMIELKTAVLLATSLKLGAIVAEAPDKDAKFLYDFGKNIGIAFQLQDDILDIYGNPQKFGKQIAGDIISNKKTFLFLKALEVANKVDESQLQNLLSSYTDNPKEKIDSVLGIFKKYQIKEIAKIEMDKFFREGLRNLDAVNADKKKKQQIAMLAESLMVREA